MSRSALRFACLAPSGSSVTETYRSFQEISRTPVLQMEGDGAVGEIRVAVPLESPGAIGHESGETCVGHLLLDRTDRTDLDRELSEMTRFGAVPLSVPAHLGSESIEARQAAVFTIPYRPLVPEVPPLEVTVDLLDSDAVEGEVTDLGGRDRSIGPASVDSLMVRRPSRGRGLLLTMEVGLRLPRAETAEAGERLAVVAEIDIAWPTVPAPESITLLKMASARARPKSAPEPEAAGSEVTPSEVIAEAHATGARTERSLLSEAVVYDPIRRSVRLPEVDLRPDEERVGDTESDFVHLRSGPRYLVIARAEDLGDEAILEARVEVRVDNLLLSGLRLRGFGADGRREERAEGRRLTTRFVGRVERVLDDAVRRWRRSPLQQLQFEHVILDEMRVQDVCTTLEDMGFTVARAGAPGGLESLFADARRLSSSAARHLVVAERPEGADTLWLWVYLRGERKTAERRTELAGGQTYTSQVTSGDLELFVRGQLDGDPRPVLAAIHELHERLRHQFQATTDRR